MFSTRVGGILNYMQLFMNQYGLAFDAVVVFVLGFDFYILNFYCHTVVLISKTNYVQLTQTSEWLDPPAGSTALGASQFAPASNFCVVI